MGCPPFTNWIVPTDRGWPRRLGSLCGAKLCRAATVLAVLTPIAGLIATSAGADSGLDSRPSNTTCLAEAVPVTNALVKAVRAFAPLTFNAPTQLRQHPADPNRWYVSERSGLIKTFTEGATTADAAFDIRNWFRFTAKDVSDSQQWGITSFAFHPAWAYGYPQMFVVYNMRPSPTLPIYSFLARYTSYDDGRTFDPNSQVVLMAVPQSVVWHHFGQLQNGPVQTSGDWHLYLGSGDGAGTLPNPLANRAQDWNSYYGGIYRVNPFLTDVSIGYGIEVFAKGFRNPWRFSFDRVTGELWAGDVGEDNWEEIDHVTRGGNYGWPTYEGPECRTSRCDPAFFQPPVHYFDHSEGAAAIGGYVYRGTEIPALYGYYVFGSASHPRLWGLTPGNLARVEIGQLPRGNPTGFFEDHRGELYAIDTSFNAVWKLIKNVGYGGTPTEPVPQLLSETGCVDPVNPVTLKSGVIYYDVNNQLWSDYAGKARGLALPNGQTISVRPNGDFDLPARTVAIKTFFLGSQPIETRLFMRHPAGGGWRGYSYEWEGSDARLLTTGKTKTIGGQTWVYPSREECMQCHNPAAGATLGLELAQLNRNFTYPETGRTANQIQTFDSIGLFGNTLPSPPWPVLATREVGGLAQRARAYLHSNCSFCHRPGGGAQANMDLRYWIPLPNTGLCDQVPLSTNLGIPDARLLAPGHPERSMVLLRMQLRDVYGMPPLATALPDWGMASVLNRWMANPAVCQ